MVFKGVSYVTHQFTVTTVCRDFIEKLVLRLQVSSTYDLSGVISMKAKEVTKHSDAHACQAAFGMAHPRSNWAAAYYSTELRNLFH